MFSPPRFFKVSAVACVTAAVAACAAGPDWAAIDSLVIQAFRSNPTVPAAQAALRQAQEMVYAQQGYFYPLASADYDFERQKLADNARGSAAPGVQAQMQRFELMATDTSLASNVVAAAIQEASTRAQIEATEEIIGHNEKTPAILRDKFEQGFAMKLDVETGELRLAQARVLLPALQKQFEQNRDLIRELVGKLPNEEVAETVELSASTLPTQLPLSLPSKIIAQRPNVRAAEQRLRAANAQVGVALAAMLPRFTITGAVGGTATQFFLPDEAFAAMAYPHAVLNRVQAQAMRFGNTAALYQALGGGWWNGKAVFGAAFQ